jgi:probable rRNA maturation factor
MFKSMSNIVISSTIKNYPRRLPLAELKQKILGVKYELSLVFIGPTRAQSLNQTYRKKDYIPNVLSFPLADTAGEIFICPQVAKKEAAKFDLSPNGYISYLFIHGCLHLKGHAHGDTMDRLERKYLKAFNIS